MQTIRVLKAYSPHTAVGSVVSVDEESANKLVFSGYAELVGETPVPAGHVDPGTTDSSVSETDEDVVDLDQAPAPTTRRKH